MRKICVRALVALLLGLIPIAGVSPASHLMAASTPSYDPNATITTVTVADPTFNLWAPNAFVESDVIDPLIFSGVTKWGLDGQPAPDLATSWSASADGLVWTFALRHGVKWQDGTPFTADDVVYTYNNIVFNKKNPSNKASNYSAIKTVRASGPYTVQFVLNSPWSALPSYLAWFAPVLPKHIFAGHANPWVLTSFNKQHPVGTGPFVMSQYVPGQSVTLTRNPSYFGPKPKIKTIIFQIVPQALTAVSDILSGGINFLEVQDPQLLAKLATNPTLTVQHVVEQNYYYVSLNLTVPRFRDVRVRQALDLAIDKNGLIKAILKGNGQVSTGPIAPLQKYYYDANVQKYPYNPAAAVKLLETAGYTKKADGKLYGKDGKPFTIALTAGQYGYLVPASELIQQYWQKIGVTVSLKVLEWNAYIQQAVVNHNYEASFVWWIAPFDPDVYPYFACDAAKTGFNFSAYCNPKLDALMVQGRRAVKPDQRRAIYNTMQELMAQELPLIFLFYPQRFHVMASNVHAPAVDYNIAIDNIADWYVSNS